MAIEIIDEEMRIMPDGTEKRWIRAAMDAESDKTNLPTTGIATDSKAFTADRKHMYALAPTAGWKEMGV